MIFSLESSKFVIAYDEREHVLIRSFASPTCLQCHSISDFGCHLGADDKCLNNFIMQPSVGGMVTRVHVQQKTDRLISLAYM